MLSVHKEKLGWFTQMPPCTPAYEGKAGLRIRASRTSLCHLDHLLARCDEHEHRTDPILTLHSQTVHLSFFHFVLLLWDSPLSSTHSVVLSRDSRLVICSKAQSSAS